MANTLYEILFIGSYIVEIIVAYYIVQALRTYMRRL